MSPRILAALLAAGCVTAAAGGAYVAVRQNRPPSPVTSAIPAAAPEPATPVSETEALVDRAPGNPPAAGTIVPDTEPASAPDSERVAVPEKKPAAAVKPDRPARASKAEPVRQAEVIRPRVPAPSGPPAPSRPTTPSAPAAERPVETSAAAPGPETQAPPMRSADTSQASREPQFDEILLPASSILGLQVETPLSSERTRLEDRVDARVTRDVTAGGRVAIAAGSRVIGSVTMVERGGKMKERARLGVRFHTLVLADGQEVPLRTETIIREGDSPSNESARKIGGAAVGGAILGAIMGGGKGAMLGGAVGAAGGSAAVMAGDRNAATLPAGTVVSVRLAAPATIDVERLPQ
jgi:outer membrane biosynthesis protein TonB